MAMSNSLRSKLIAAAGGGATLIATVFPGGKDGVEGRVYVPYKDVAGVCFICAAGLFIYRSANLCTTH